MLYVLTDGLKDRSWWGLIVRRYLLALAKSGCDFRVVWRQGALHREEVEEEFGLLFDGRPGESYQRDIVEWQKPPWWAFWRPPRRITRQVTEQSHVSYFGGGGPGTAMLYIGDVFGALEVFKEELNRGPVNIALVQWPEIAIPEHMAEGLNQYDLVLVPGNCEAFRECGVKNVRSIQLPSPRVPEPAESEPDGTLVYYAIGSWGGYDNLQEVVEQFDQRCVGRDDAFLYLVCPDVPYGVKNSRIAVDPVFSKTAAEWREVHELGDTYISCSRRADFDPWELDARQHGNAVGWDGCALPRNLATDGFDEHVGKELAQAVERAQLNASGAKTIAFIIPHRNRGVEWIERTLAALAPQLGIGDEVIVADQDSETDVYDQLLRYCTGEGISLITCSGGPNGEWSIAKARNAGARAARELGVDYVMFLDCDIRLPTGYVDALRLELAPTRIVIPFVHEPGRPTRIGSGLMALSLDLLEQHSGFDESFFDHGGEDIEFLDRVGGEHSIGEVPNVEHEPHQIERNIRNEERVRQLLGTDHAVDQEGWGWFDWNVQQGEEVPE